MKPHAIERGISVFFLRKRSLAVTEGSRPVILLGGIAALGLETACLDVCPHQSISLLEKEGVSIFTHANDDIRNSTKRSTTVGTGHDGGGPIVGHPWMLHRGLSPIVVQSGLNY